MVPSYLRYGFLPFRFALAFGAYQRHSGRVRGRVGVRGIIVFQ